MAKVLIANIDVYTVSLGGNGGALYFVFSRSRPENEFPSVFSWRIDFCGSGDELLNDYLPMMMHHFDEGFCQGVPGTKIGRSGAGFRRHFLARLKAAQPLSRDEMASYGYEAYCWRPFEYERSGASCGVPIPNPAGDELMAMYFDSDDDIGRMAQEIVNIKASFHSSTSTVWEARPQSIPAGKSPRAAAKAGGVYV